MVSPRSSRRFPVAPRTAAILLALVAVAGFGWWWSRQQANAAESGFRTAAVERGDIRVAISATGTLAAISTVDVGSQISGQVTAVLADFNDRVRKDQVIARIDPSTYQAQIAQGRRRPFASAQRQPRHRAGHPAQCRGRLHPQGPAGRSAS
jgi:HlyD family secretion protein